MNIPPEVIAAIKSSFENAKYPKTVKTRPCRIKFNGEFITTSSKKTVWRNKGFAKSALLNHLQPIGAAINQYILKKNALTSTHHYSYVDSRIIKELRDELEKLGIIEYVEVDMEDFAVQKK
jgi:hypothetical protein